jgi:DNA polymerase
MSDRQDLARHLSVFVDLGVAGVSRDPKWRQREGVVVGQTFRSAAEAGSEDPASTSPAIDPVTGLQALRAEIGPDCTRCKLHGLGRRQVVFGVGNPHAQLMFVGEAPGADEDVQGEPFVGRAGQLLTKIIEAIDLKRSDVYIANVIKCRPPGNRNPEPDEVATCQPFLFRQIDMIRPRVIVALGTFAAHALLGTDAPISKLRGQVMDFRGGSRLIPTFHPAFLLRSPDRKRDVWEDMKKVRALLNEPS